MCVHTGYRAWLESPSNIKAARFLSRGCQFAKQISYTFKKEIHNTNSRPWSDLPLELVYLIASKLPLADRISFPSVCKSWSFTSTSLSNAKCWPWLMYVPNDHNGYMFDSLDGKAYPMDDGVTAEGHLVLRFLKDGCEVPSGRNHTIFMMNPFTLEQRANLPRLDSEYRFYGISFSSLPANSVFHGGLFYCLGRLGNLGVFDPKDESWTVLDKPKPPEPKSKPLYM